MTQKGFIEESIRRFGRVKVKVPLVDILDGKVSRFGNSYSLGGMLDRAKQRMLNPNPIVPNAADIINAIIWDTYTVAAGASIGSNFKFFTQPIGTNNKTNMDTNMEQVQRLPDPQWMNVIGIGFMFGPEVQPVDIITLCNNYYQDFWVGGKVYAQGRYEMFPSSTGVSSPSIATNGFPSWTNMFDLRLTAGLDLGVQKDPETGEPRQVISDGLIGVTILQGQQFKVENNAPGGAQSASAAAAGGKGVRLVAQLYGILSRGVQ